MNRLKWAVAAGVAAWYAYRRRDTTSTDLAALDHRIAVTAGEQDHSESELPYFTGGPADPPQDTGRPPDTGTNLTHDDDDFSALVVT